MQTVSYLRNLWPILGAIALWFLVAAAIHRTRTLWLGKALRIVAALLLRRRLFRVPLDADISKLNFLRMVLGALFFARSLSIAEFVFFGPADLLPQAACVIVLALAAMLAVGFMTPIAGVLLLFFNTLFLDSLFKTYTLGSDVLSILLIVFVFLPAGTRFSLDRWLVERQGVIPGGVSRLYALTGRPTLLRAVISKSAALLSYGMLCIYSAMAHLHDPAWLSGDAAPLLLTSSYLTPHFAATRQLFAEWPLAVWLFRLSMYVMFIWYFTFILFSILGGPFKKFIVVWSILFFGLSTFVLNLGWLGYYEFVFLVILFWDRRFLNRRGVETLLILYDDRCNLCDRTMRAISFIDLFSIARYRPLSKNLALAATHAIDPQQAMTDLYAIDPRNRRIFSGYEFYVALSRRILLALPAYPFLLLGRWLWLGPAVYRYIADRRTRLFGVCTLPIDPAQLECRSWPLHRVTSREKTAGNSLFGSYMALHVVFAALFIWSLPGVGTKLGHFVRTMAHANGFMRIDVFNQHDLTLSEHWFTVAVTDANGVQTLLPYVGDKGERLTWHESDRVYFGNSLLWRRSKNAQPAVCYDEGDLGYLREIAKWHEWRSTGLVNTYVLTYYYEPLPDLSDTTSFHYPDPVVVCTRTLDSSLNLVGP